MSYIVASFCGYCKGLLKDKEENFHGTCHNAVIEYQPKPIKLLVCVGCLRYFCDKECFDIEHLFNFDPASHTVFESNTSRIDLIQKQKICGCCKKEII